MQLLEVLLHRIPGAIRAGWPILVLLAYVGLGLFARAANRLAGEIHDPEMDARGAGGLIGARVRHFFAWLMRPFWKTLVFLEVPPDALTTLSVALALAAGVAVAAGRFALGGWLYLVAGALDFLDGRVARESGRVSRRGAALDSVLDRYVDGAVLVGLAWFFRSSWVLAPVLLALTGSFLVPYVRARGEALGVVVDGVGFVQRPERVVLLGLSLALGPVVDALWPPTPGWPPVRLVIPCVVALALMAHATALQRLLHLCSALGSEGAPSSTRTSVAQAARVMVGSAVATSADFATFYALIETTSVTPAVATALGCLVGAAISFTMNRVWAFESSHPIGSQISRYAFVSATSALLNAGGVAVVLSLPRVVPSAAWIAVRGMVFVTWTFPMFRDYVYALARPPLGLGAEVRAPAE